MKFVKFIGAIALVSTLAACGGRVGVTLGASSGPGYYAPPPPPPTVVRRTTTTTTSNGYGF